MLANNNRLAYISKERDKESSLADHGVRKYDAEIGRFTSCDALWGKYFSLNPYHYCNNNPVSYEDGNGFIVVAAGDKEKEIILNSVEEKYREYVTFNEKNEVVISSMPIDTDLESNFYFLAELACWHETFVVEITDYENVYEGNGIYNNNKNYAWGMRRKAWGDFIPPNYYPNPTKEDPVSQTKNAQVLLSVEWKRDRQGEFSYVHTLCEELYSHAYFYYLGKNFSHNYKGSKNDAMRNSDGTRTDFNKALVKQMRKTRKNARKK